MTSSGGLGGAMEFLGPAEARALFQAALAIGGEMELRARLDRVLDALLELLGVHAAQIALVDAATDELEVVGERGLGREALGTRQPVSVGLAATVLAASDPVYCPDVLADPRTWDPELARKRGVRSWLAVRLADRQGPYGTLTVLSQHPDAFRPQHHRLLQSFAALAAAAVREARLYAEAQAEIAERSRTAEALAKSTARLNLLHEIDRAIIAEDTPAAIAEAVLRRVRDLLGVPRAIVNLFDLATSEAEWLAAVGRHRIRVGPGVRFPLTLMGDVAALQRGERQLIRIDALPPSPHVDALRASGVDVYTVVPMRVGDELIGALSFGGPSADFPPEQIRIAEEVAAQMAIAIHQARFRERMAHQRDALARAEKLAALGRLAAGVVHELRNPLTVIAGRVDLLKAKLDAGRPVTPEELARQARALEEAAGRMRRIMEGLSMYSKPSKPAPAPLDVRPLLGGLAELVAYQARETSVTVKIETPPSLPAVMGDRSDLTQVLLNLATNAIEAMRETGGGVLTVRAAADADHLRVAVEDTGPGIPPETLEQIWHPFYTTKAEGTGLGLSIVRGLVENQPGARLDVASVPGHGTTFTITMPVVRNG